MTYVTVRQSPMYHQMSLEDLLFGEDDKSQLITRNRTNTRTYEVEEISEKLKEKTDAVGMISALTTFNRETEELRSKPRESLYRTFYTEKKGKGMPYVFKKIYEKQDRYIGGDKSSALHDVSAALRSLCVEHETAEDENARREAFSKSANALKDAGFKISDDDISEIFGGAYRRIDAPKSALKGALYKLKDIFEETCGTLYHTSAFAYVRGRSAIDAVRRHQANESNWFGKFDLANFFGSTTVEFIQEMFSRIYPFSEILDYGAGETALCTALSLCTLNDVLPQGTPISPTITNIMMIPIDFRLSNTLRDFKKQKYIYTRYADDFLISSRYDFDVKKIEGLINETLSEFNAPFKIKVEKTRYGSRAGSNWNLGVMLNKDNEITVGYKNKRRFRAMVSSYVMDKKNGHPWDLSDVRELEGYRSYYRMVEGERIDEIVKHIGDKFNVDVVKMIKNDLKFA